MLGRLTENTFFDAHVNHQASLFAQGNGYLGVRGSHPEGHAHQEIGCYLNGFSDTHTISYGESAYGFPTESDFIVNIPNPLVMEVTIDGERVVLSEDRVTAFEQVYDFESLVVTRKLKILLHDGRPVEIQSKTLIPRHPRNLFIMRYEVTPPPGTQSFSVDSRVLLNVFNRGASDDPRVGTQGGGRRLTVESTFEDRAATMRTLQSDQVLMTCLDNRLLSGQVLHRKKQASADVLCETFSCGPQTLVIEKRVGYYTRRDFESELSVEGVLERFDKEHKLKLDDLIDQQKKTLAQILGPLKIDVPDHPEVEEALVFNALHLYNGAGSDGLSNLPAKGLSGEGYEGHYFWDTEIYAIPFFAFVAPDIAKGLLTFRVNTLDGARKRARMLGHEKGAKIPWRTITGRECSAYFPAGTAQYHINADVAYAIYLYEKATGDRAFVDEQCAELLIETARIWMDIGHFSDRGFAIDAVTGPDEYTAIVNNNYYTNRLAAHHLAYAAKVARRQSHDQGLYRRLDLTEKELEGFERASREMFLPYDEALGITLQDDHFHLRKPWPFEKTKQEEYPLLLHFHPLTIYRHQVLKQPDVVLAHILLGQGVSKEQKARDYRYYEALTTHDSSLSPSVHAILALEIDDEKMGDHYFRENLRLDIDNTHNNSDHGLHMAAMAGSWMSFTYGFGGLRITDKGIRLSPVRVSSLGDYRFRLRHKSCLLEVAVDQKGVTYGLIEGETLTFTHGDQEVTLGRNQKTLTL